MATDTQGTLSGPPRGFPGKRKKPGRNGPGLSKNDFLHDYSQLGIANPWLLQKLRNAELLLART